MKVWITKYALTEGIFTEEVERVSESFTMVKVKYSYYHGEGKEWHLTLESAIAKAEEMRKKKIANLQKQLKKLETLKFE